MGKLVLFRADGTAQDVKLDRERITIGRRPDNDLCLAYPAVSGEHAAVVTILADSFLEDVGSTNGKLVNGNPISKHFLRDRDEIDIARQILVYLADDTAKLDSPPQSRDRSKDRPNGDGAVRAPTLDGTAQAAEGPQHDKRRSDGLAQIPGQSVDAIQRFVAAEIESGRSEVAAPVRDTGVGRAERDRSDASAFEPGSIFANLESLPPGRSNHSGFALKVVGGAAAGRIVELNKSETLIGRAGVQVAALRRTADEIRVVPLEDASPPLVNGAPVAPDGQTLVTGDILELAGMTLELVVATN